MIKRIKIGRPEHLLIPLQPYSDSISFLSYPPPGPPSKWMSRLYHLLILSCKIIRIYDNSLAVWLFPVIAIVFFSFYDHFCNYTTIMFKIFWDLLMVEQIFLPPQVKRSMIISAKLVLTSCLTSYQTTKIALTLISSRRFIKKKKNGEWNFRKY